MTKHTNERAEIKFFHGWAYQANSWRGWQDSLGSAHDLEFYDRGYFGNAKSIAPYSQGDHHKIIIAHSLGLHFVPPEILKDADIIVMIGTFRHFHEFSGDEAASLATTRAMRNRLQRNAEKVLRDFYKQSGDAESRTGDLETQPGDFGTQIDGSRMEPGDSATQRGGKLNINLLTQDLHFLDRSRYEIANHPVQSTSVLLHGERDAIANSNHASALGSVLPQTSLFLHASANHALPFSESGWCLLQLARVCPQVFAREMSELPNSRLRNSRQESHVS